MYAHCNGCQNRCHQIFSVIFGIAANVNVWAVAGNGRANEGGTTDLPDRSKLSAVTERYLKN
jgi:hypothetical protein